MTRFDRMRNVEVRRRTGVNCELAARVDRYVLRWSGHMERMEERRLVKKVMKAKVNGRGMRGRPRVGWME